MYNLICSLGLIDVEGDFHLTADIADAHKQWNFYLTGYQEEPCNPTE
jgi:hypothetical protein